MLAFLFLCLYHGWLIPHQLFSGSKVASDCRGLDFNIVGMIVFLVVTTSCFGSF